MNSEPAIKQETAEDVISKLYDELDQVVSGKYPDHEQLSSWLRNKYSGIEGYFSLAIDKGLVDDIDSARIQSGRFLGTLMSIYVEIDKTGSSSYTESQASALAFNVEMIKMVFKLPKN